MSIVFSVTLPSLQKDTYPLEDWAESKRKKYKMDHSQYFLDSCMISF